MEGGEEEEGKGGKARKGEKEEARLPSPTLWKAGRASSFQTPFLRSFARSIRSRSQKLVHCNYLSCRK